MNKKIVIKHNGGLATSIFIIENIFILFIFLYPIYNFIIKLTTGKEIENSFYFLLAIFPFVLIRILKLLKEIYSLKEYVLTESKLIIGKKEYSLDEIALKYLPTWPSTLLAAELFIKDNKKVIGLLIINFWAGSILNITPDTLEKIFEKRNFSNIQTDKEISTKNVTSVDMHHEKMEIKQFDIAWYLVYAVLLIPVALILYLMVKN